jgi:hypothetical protein
VWGSAPQNGAKKKVWGSAPQNREKKIERKKAVDF